MKLLITTIIILIIIVVSIIIFNSNIYFSEDFANYDQNTIEDLISVSYLPFNPYETEKINEYEVIEIYKKTLNRSPTVDEIKMKVYLTKEELTEDLYNSSEYDKISKLQNNLADSNMESSIAKRNLSAKIMDMYKRIYDKEVPIKMVVPLRDCYIHLRSNYYLFQAFLESKSYPKFEDDVLTKITLTKKNLLEIFNDNYNLLELKLAAQEKIKLDRNKRTISTSIISDELKKLSPISEPAIVKQSQETNVDLKELRKYLSPLELKETYQNPDELLKVREKEKIDKDVINNLPKDSEVYVRVYNPINYKQTYRGNPPPPYKPPICTSLGQKQLEMPVFTESKLLFQGTELERAFTDTQVGSIMPKFEYKEYQDVRIK